MKTSVLFIVTVTIMGLVSCAETTITEDPSLPIIFANNRVMETTLKSIEQTSTWSEGDSFGVYATESALSTFTFMSQNTMVSFSNLNGWGYENPTKWPSKSEKFTFFAYFPYVSENQPTLTDENGGRFNLEYGVKESVKLQEDLLWGWVIDAYELLPSGYNTIEGSNNTAFAFQHALSKVKFRVKANDANIIFITSLSLTAYGNGLFSTIRTDGYQDPITTPTWETRDPLMTFSIIDEFIPSADNKFGYMANREPRDIGFILTQNNDSDADYQALMIPQAKTEIKIRLTYNIINNYTIGTPEIKEVIEEFEDIDFQYDWLLGHQYIYNIDIDMENATLTTSVGSWDDFSEIL